MKKQITMKPTKGVIMDRLEELYMAQVELEKQWDKVQADYEYHQTGMEIARELCREVETRLNEVERLIDELECEEE